MNKSTKRVLALFALIATLGLGSAMAQNSDPAHFTIPFSFTVGSKAFAAGDYRVAHMTPYIIRIDGDHRCVNILPVPIGDKPGNAATLSFHRYGESYFLVKVTNRGHEWGLTPSVLEKELIAKLASSERLDLVASSKK